MSVHLVQNDGACPGRRPEDKTTTLVALTTRETYKTPLRELGNPVSDAEIEAGLHHGSHPRSGR